MIDVRSRADASRSVAQWDRVLAFYYRRDSGGGARRCRFDSCRCVDHVATSNGFHLPKLRPQSRIDYFPRIERRHARRH